MARKKKIGLYDIGRVPVTEVGNKSGYENNKELSARLRREEAEELAKKRQAIEDADPTRQAEKAMIAAETKVALQRSDRLTKLYRDVRIAEDYIRHDIEALVDDIGLPTQNPPVTMNEFETRIKAFVEALPTSVTFSDDAKRKFELYAFVAARQGTVIDNSTLQTLLERAESLGLGITLPKVNKQATVKPKPTATEHLTELLQTTSGESREGKRLLETAVEDAALVDVARPLFAEWLSHLYTDFGGFKPSEDDKRYIINVWIPKSNLSYTAASTYHAARRHMVSIFRWPDSLLTPDEKLSRELEDVPLNDYQARRDALRRVRDSRG
jgi:hypothetical protein